MSNSLPDPLNPNAQTLELQQVYHIAAIEHPARLVHQVANLGPVDHVLIGSYVRAVLLLPISNVRKQQLEPSKRIFGCWRSSAGEGLQSEDIHFTKFLAQKVQGRRRLV